MYQVRDSDIGHMNGIDLNGVHWELKEGMVRAPGGFKEDFPDKTDLNPSSQEESSSRPSFETD